MWLIFSMVPGCLPQFNRLVGSFSNFKRLLASMLPASLRSLARPLASKDLLALRLPIFPVWLNGCSPLLMRRRLAGSYSPSYAAGSELRLPPTSSCLQARRHLRLLLGCCCYSDLPMESQTSPPLAFSWNRLLLDMATDWNPFCFLLW